MNHVLRALSAASLLSVLVTGTAHAQADDRPVRGILGAGLTFGGEKLATAQFTNGGSQSIRTGGLVQFYGGAEFRLGTLVTVQATAGYHVDDTSASNGSIRFSRWPLELLGHVAVNEQVRLGGGIRHINGAKLNASGAGSSIAPNVDFDATTGVVIEGEYRFSPSFGLKLRYVTEDYTVKGTPSKFKGNHVGLMGNFYF
jgi:hypothetical protein